MCSQQCKLYGMIWLAGAMDEVDWLKSRLEHLESNIVSQSLGSRGDPQGRPVSRRGRSGKGGSASEPSDQVCTQEVLHIFGFSVAL